MFSLFEKFTKQKEVIDPKVQTANEFVNVKNIKGSILYTKDGYIFTYIKIAPISLDLLSDEEKKSSYRSLTASLSSETKPFKIFAISRPVDISSLIDDLYSTYMDATDERQRKLLAKEMDAINNFAMTGDVIERQFYIIIWEKYSDNGANDLQKRAIDLARKFEENKTIATVLDQSMIVQLCNLFANPNYAHLEDDDISPTIPLIKGGKYLWERQILKE